MSVRFMYGARIETKTVLIYFLETEPQGLHKSKEQPNTGMDPYIPGVKIDFFTICM